MRVLICGARDFTDRRRLFQALTRYHRIYKFTLLIEGGAKGADKLANEWARENGVPVQTFMADWESYGRAAGPIRNKQMLEKGRPDLVIAFPKTTMAKSKGTKNMVDQARKAGVRVYVKES